MNNLQRPYQDTVLCIHVYKFICSGFRLVSAVLWVSGNFTLVKIATLNGLSTNGEGVSYNFSSLPYNGFLVSTTLQVSCCPQIFLFAITVWFAVKENMSINLKMVSKSSAPYNLFFFVLFPSPSPSPPCNFAVL